MLSTDDSVQNLLRFTDSSNAPLPDAAKRQLQALISTVRKDIMIDLIDSPSSQSRDSPDFASLRSEKSALLARLKAAVSPIRDLPLEIVEEILSSCISATVDLAALELGDPPWNLTQICAAWRGVALGLPSLWNNITVEFPCSQRERCAHIFLSRTGNSTISLNLRATMFLDDNPSCRPFIDSIINCVRPHAGRLRLLELQPAQVFMPIMVLPSALVHALEFVCLNFTKEDNSSPRFFGPGIGFTNKITAFETARNLHSVTLISEYADMHLSVFRFPWSQLTHLIILDTFVYFADGHEVLRQCTGLVSCSTGITTDIMCYATLPPTLLRNLVSLTIHAYDAEEEHGRFLEPFVLPSLRHLELASEGCAWSEMNVLPLIRRSTPAKLESFHSTALIPRDVSGILAEVPSLKELSLCFLRGEEPDPSLDMLVTAIARGDLVPNIQSFELELQASYSWDSEVSLFRKPCVRIQCRPEEIQLGFWDFWVKLQQQDSMDIIIQEADGAVWGFNGSVISL